jgi:hypothetical protein
MLSLLKLLLTITVSDTLASNSFTDFYDFDTSQYDLSTSEIIITKIKEIVSSGFTIEEFQKAMLILCLIRFIIYAFKYNILTSFKICAIGLISCTLWGIALNDCVGVYFPILKYNPLLNRILEEEVAFRQVAEREAFLKANAFMISQLGDQHYPFEWITPLFARIPENLTHLTDPIYRYIRMDLSETVKTFYKSNLRQMLPFIIYILVVRVGKKYCPYHIRWHFTFVTLYNTFITYIFSCTMRARELLFQTLIPQHRFEEAETLQIYLGAIAFVHMTFIMLAMLHAIFSQYFYLPFLTYSVELHIGKRPKTSIYSGGYTAWQDDFVFYNIKLRDSLRLWWGFLGKGTKRSRGNNGKRKNN